MTSTVHASTSAGDPSLGVAVHCTRGALGEWFTLIPRSPQRASELRRYGVPAGASLTGADLRYELERLGLPEAAIDDAVAQARRAATTITVQRSVTSMLYSLFG